MNYQLLSVENYQSVSDMQEDAKRRRQALMGGQKGIVTVAERKKLQDEISRLNEMVLGLKAENAHLADVVVEKDAIIYAHEQTINNLTNSDDGTENRRTVKEIVLGTLNEFPRVSYAQVVGASRTHSVVEARHTCIYAVHRARPDLSLTQIGKLFGGRDHTSILHCIRKMEAGLGGVGD